MGREGREPRAVRHRREMHGPRRIGPKATINEECQFIQVKVSFVSWLRSAANGHVIRFARLAAAALIAVFLLYVALLPSPPLPEAVHHILRMVEGPATHHPGPAWVATALRKLPEALLYGLLAILLMVDRRHRIPVFVGVSLYGLALELLRLTHGRAFEPFDVLYEVVAALVGIWVGHALSPKESKAAKG